jgi:pimeloyl-ACP methyl ester carboxylesterase
MTEIDREFIGLTSPTATANPVGYHPCQGVYHTPAGARPKVAIIATHYNVDFSEHYLAPLMAERGYGFLGWNTRYRGAEAYFILEQALVDIGVGVKWLRQEAGVETVVVLGNSGGGSLMGAYQSQATTPNIEATYGMGLPADVEELIPAELYISLNAHMGRPEVLTDWWDPSATDEHDPLATDPALDMYNPANGPPYSDEFIKTYRAAQVERNHRITAWCLSEIDRLAESGNFERVFSLQRVWADLRYLDGDIDPSDRPLNTCYAGNPKWANYNAWGIGPSNTLRTWLSMWSLEHSQCRGVPHLQRIKVPALVIQSTADTGVYPSDARTIHENLAADDKELHMIEGDHYLGLPETARADVADMLAAWIAARV